MYDKYKQHIVHPAEKYYFKKALSLKRIIKYRVPQIYGTPKIHKPLINRRDKIPHFRSVVTCINSLPEVPSKWCNLKLNEAIQHSFTTIIKDNKCIRTSLTKKFPNGVPNGLRLFLLDAEGMYNNVHQSIHFTKYATGYKHIKTNTTKHSQHYLSQKKFDDDYD